MLNPGVWITGIEQGQVGCGSEEDPTLNNFVKDTGEENNKHVVVVREREAGGGIGEWHSSVFTLKTMQNYVALSFLRSHPARSPEFLWSCRPHGPSSAYKIIVE